MVALFSALIAPVLMASLGQDVTVGPKGSAPEKDPHRPACRTAACRNIKSYLKKHYCGQSPFGNGPDDGCEIRGPKNFGTRLVIKADRHCEWNENEGKSNCHQSGEPRAELRTIAMREMRRLGLPDKPVGPVYFTVWESPSSGWSLVQAQYSHVVDAISSGCEVILLVGNSSNGTVVRQVRFHKTDADVPQDTSWELVDLADVDGDGQLEVVLEGDSYEDHWLEVVRVEEGSAKTIFSGLGYYL